ncbi:hypothetical protein M3Y99_00537200 [Aphelenchoides fujianensis]|nr:hypothetical protein M3Y99_01302200 [Aphelenchoides fujianensis]KAI6239713.1 hypothetical protein M3Y99_00537200 [Aphelenchoides fujianensis]
MAAADVMRVSNREEDRMNNEASMSGRTIVGVIIPPPDIRAIVEKTAQFVARNGIDFENKIKEKEAANPRFGFLSPTDPYHAFYRQKVAAFESGAVAEGAPRVQLPEAVREHVQQAEAAPKHPPPAFEFTADPATLNAFDLDLMRMTAMFVARNGRSFMTNLMQREHRNHQFDFLKPAHSNFPYFTKLVEQYTKVLIPSHTVVEELARSLNYELVLGDVRYRVAWERHQRASRERETRAVEQERLAYNAIDWHDFVVVQTVDFQPSETLNLPPLCTPRDVGSRVLMQQRTEAAKAAAESVEMDVDSDSDQEEAAGKPQEQEAPGRPAHDAVQPTPVPPNVDSALVRDYDPRKDRVRELRRPNQEKFLISPLTNERIAADQLHDHVRYSTFDPKYKEQRNRDQTVEQDDASLMSSSGTEISRNIARLAERRSDIFGITTPVAGEWALDGRPFFLSVDLRSTVAELKALIQEKTTVPVGKQKLCYEGMYPKDTNTLAFYNLNNGHIVQLQLKERGGRKK